MVGDDDGPSVRMLDLKNIFGPIEYILVGTGRVIFNMDNDKFQPTAFEQFEMVVVIIPVDTMIVSSKIGSSQETRFTKIIIVIGCRTLGVRNAGRDLIVIANGYPIGNAIGFPSTICSIEGVWVFQFTKRCIGV